MKKTAKQIIYFRLSENIEKKFQTILKNKGGNNKTKQAMLEDIVNFYFNFYFEKNTIPEDESFYINNKMLETILKTTSLILMIQSKNFLINAKETDKKYFENIYEASLNISQNLKATSTLFDAEVEEVLALSKRYLQEIKEA